MQAGTAARLLALSAASPAAGDAAAVRKPHIIFVHADDWGYNNVGLKDPATKTPNFDDFAARSLKLDRYYTYKFCSPTRVSFLSGRLPMHVKQDNLEQGGIPLAMKTVADGLQAAGYHTYQLGKWHAGFATQRHLPVNRGFHGSLGYFHACEDPYNQHEELAQGLFVDLWDTDKPAYGLNGTYDTYIWDARMKQVIGAHDPATPLFLYYAFKNLHSPLYVPQRFLDLYPGEPVSPPHGPMIRGLYLAQASAWDEGFGNLTAALRARGMWNSSLVAVASDNGGPIYDDAFFDALRGGATNYPLRGGKMSNWEGGVRVNAWVGGGFLPAGRRGAVTDALIHVCDWRATFFALTGAAVPAEDGVPPPDGVDQWPVLAGTSSGPARTEVPLDAKLEGVVLISGRHKLIVGTEGQDVWTGPAYPNGTEPHFPPGDPMGGKPGGPLTDCGEGCLFDIFSDPGEHHDLASALPNVLAALRNRSMELNATYWQHDSVRWDTEAAKAKARTQAAANGGFWGPYEP